MIKNLIKGGQQNSQNTEPAQGNNAEAPVTGIFSLIPSLNLWIDEIAQPSKPQTEPVLPEGETLTGKEEVESLSNLPMSHRKYLTPQLSADLSHFSGLSLRLENEGTNDKGDKLASFPLRYGRPLVIGVRK